MFYFVARWLAQEDLGLFRTYNLILVLVSMVAGLSLDYLYIIENRRSQTQLIALWQISILAGIVAFIALTAAAGIIGQFYHSSSLALIFRFTSVFILVEIFRKAVRAVAQKQQQFRQLALAETANVMFYSVLSVIGLFFYRSLWVYLILFYLGNVVELIWLWMINHKVHSRMLRAALNPKRFFVLGADLVKNSSFLSLATLVSALNQLTGNAPILILGIFVDPIYLGMFYFASQIVGVPVGMFTSAVTSVFFPVFAGSRDAAISQISSRYARLVGWLGLPLLMLFSFLSIYAIDWMFGSKWSGALPLLPIMVVLYGSNLYCSSLSGIPFAKRKPQWELYWNVSSLLLRVSAMLMGLQYSFYAAMWAFAISSAVMHFAFYVMCMLLVQISISQALKDLLMSIIPAIILGGLFYLVYRLDTFWAIGSGIIGTCLLIMAINVLSKGKLWTETYQLTGWKRP